MFESFLFWWWFLSGLGWGLLFAWLDLVKDWNFIWWLFRRSLRFWDCGLCEWWSLDFRSYMVFKLSSFTLFEFSKFHFFLNLSFWPILLFLGMVWIQLNFGELSISENFTINSSCSKNLFSGCYICYGSLIVVFRLDSKVLWTSTKCG